MYPDIFQYDDVVAATANVELGSASLPIYIFAMTLFYVVWYVKFDGNPYTMTMYSVYAGICYYVYNYKSPKRIPKSVWTSDSSLSVPGFTNAEDNSWLFGSSTGKNSAVVEDKAYSVFGGDSTAWGSMSAYFSVVFIYYVTCYKVIIRSWMSKLMRELQAEREELEEIGSSVEKWRVGILTHLAVNLKRIDWAAKQMRWNEKKIKQ